MSLRLRSVLIVVGVLVAVGCGGPVTTQKMIDDSIAAAGGAEKLKTIKAVTLKGSGTQTFFGQGVNAADPGPPSTLEIVEIYDYANGRAAIEYDLNISPSSPYGAFKSHRREVLTRSGQGAAARPVGYVMTAGKGPAFVMSPNALYGYALYPSPETSMRRSYLGLLLEISGADTRDEITQDREFGGKRVKFGTATTKQGEPLDLYFDPENKLLVGYQISETHPVMGDLRSTYTFEDLKPVEGILIPHRVKVQGEAGNSGEITYTSVIFGDGSVEQILMPPESASDVAKAASGDYTPLELVTVAPGVLQAKGYSNNSLVVEFPRWLVVVEPAQGDVQTKVLGQLLKQQFPGKSVQYVGFTHPHHDHIGGLRGFAALGATILVEKSHEADIRKIMDARHSYPPDELENARRRQQNVGGIEIFEGKKVISDGGRTLELHAVHAQTSAETMVFAYLPKERLLFQSDFTPQLRPQDFRILFDAITKLRLRPDRIVGGHGGITSFAEFVKAARPS